MKRDDEMIGRELEEVESIQHPRLLAKSAQASNFAHAEGGNEKVKLEAST